MKHIAVITQKPVLSGQKSTPDGAITGNGDLAVILGNCAEGMRIYLSKADLWHGVEDYNKGGIRPLGYIDIPVDKALYDNYYVEQDMDTAQIRCRFADGDKVCAVNITVPKTENAVVIESFGDVPVCPVLKVFEQTVSGENGTFEEDGVNGIYRSFTGDDCLYETHISAALKQVSQERYYAFAVTNHDTENARQTCIEKIKKTDDKRVKRLLAEHDKAWRSFWSKSMFSVDDEDLELGWYASQYMLAVCSGNTKFPPGIFGNFITVETPSWHGDYHLNYNYQAPFYASASSNHVEFTDGYITPLEEMVTKGEHFAHRFGAKGILFPVGIAPKGICTEMRTDMHWGFDRLFLGQKSNAIHPADILVMRWRATRDEEYAAKHAYPYIKNCLRFFETYLSDNNGTLHVKQDAAHEVPIYRADYKPYKYRKYLNDTDNALTLGLIRMCLDAALDMARTLQVDEDKQAVWEDMQKRLAPFATYIRKGKRVYRYTKKGQAWNDTNDVGLQHIYPAGCIGLSSSTKELSLARATFLQRSGYCYEDDNAVCSYFPMAARLGIEPKIIIEKLHNLNQKRRLPNMLYYFGGGCLEDCPIPANTLNEMVLQSHQNVIRLFPCWDFSLNCTFKTLRADGAFLISSSVQDGKMGKTEIFAEKGGMLRLILPTFGATVIQNGKKSLVGRYAEVQTEKGETVTVIPLY